MQMMQQHPKNVIDALQSVEVRRKYARKIGLGSWFMRFHGGAPSVGLFGDSQSTEGCNPHQFQEQTQ